MCARRIIRKKIGELLIERNIITAEQLNAALEQQKKKGGYISQHLISLRAVTEADIANCLATQYDFAYLPLKNYSISPEVLEIIPLKLINVYSILPIDKIDGIVTVAMADPLNDGVIEMLKQITNCEIEVFISTYSELRMAIDKYFGQKIKEMEKYTINEKDLVKGNITQPFIQTLAYGGPERRRYRRIDIELDMDYFLQGKAFKAKIKNLSFGGIFFVSQAFLPIDSDVLCKIYIKNMFIDAVIQIVRVEKTKEVKKIDSYEVSIDSYGTAGFFSFLTDEDRKKLFVFLKEKIGKS